MRDNDHCSIRKTLALSSEQLYALSQKCNVEHGLGQGTSKSRRGKYMLLPPSLPCVLHGGDKVHGCLQSDVQATCAQESV